MPEGKRFPKGVSGNPAGRPSVPVELKESKRLTAQLFQDSLNKLATMTHDELVAFIGKPGDPKRPGDPKALVLEKIIAGQILAAMKGQTSAFSALLDRAAAIGPVTRKVQIDQGIAKEFSEMTPEEKQKLLDEVEKRNAKDPGNVGPGTGP